MKRIYDSYTIWCLIVMSAISPCSMRAADSPVPIYWTVETSRVQPAQFSAYRGETLELSATMLSDGNPVVDSLEGAQLYWQTNGMGSAYWTAPASCSSNVLSAVWSPTNDVGAATYNCFIGVPGGNYRAAFKLRMLDSPGFVPNILPMPEFPSSIVTSDAGVPIHWTVETSTVQPVQISAYRGETLELSATMLSYGKPYDGTYDSIALYWQTNGMGSAYWSAPASCISNTVAAVWSPTNDVGAATYHCFVGEPGGNYRIAFQLRLLDSPGSVPNALELPTAMLDFDAVNVVHAPYYTRGECDGLFASSADINAATNALARPDITTTTGGETRTEKGDIVYSNARLMIREVPTANGQTQFRLIRRSE